MPRHWFIGLCYSLIALWNLYRQGVRSPFWICWALLAIGALTLVYPPVEEGGKPKRGQESLANGAGGGGRTLTTCKGHGILSPARLPVSPLRLTLGEVRTKNSKLRTGTSKRQF